MIRRLLGDHDRGGVRVRARDRRHHRGVDDAQALDAVDAQLAITTAPIAQSTSGGRRSGSRARPSRRCPAPSRTRGAQRSRSIALSAGCAAISSAIRTPASMLARSSSVVEEVAEHARLRVGHRGAQHDLAARRRLDDHRAERVAVVGRRRQALVEERRRREVELDVVRRKPRPRVEEAARLGVVRGERPRPSLSRSAKFSGVKIPKRPGSSVR